MNHDLEKRLEQMTPAGPPVELRSRVLAAVGEELRHGTPLPDRRSFRPGLAAVAALLASLSLNFWVNDRLNQRLAAVFGPAATQNPGVEIATKKRPTGEPLRGQPGRSPASRHERDAGHEYVVQLQYLIRQLTTDFKDIADEAPRKNPQVDRDHRGSRDYHRPAVERLLRLEHRTLA